jgi:hypothetical protein
MSLLTAFNDKRKEMGTKALADALGIKDSAVRMVSTGNYPNPTPILTLFARRFINVVSCPYAQRTLERDECKTRSTAPRPLGGKEKLNWWTACQSCDQRGGR